MVMLDYKLWFHQMLEILAAPIVWLLFSAWCVALEYFAFPLENQGVLFPQQKEQLKPNKIQNTPTKKTLPTEQKFVEETHIQPRQQFTYVPPRSERLYNPVREIKYTHQMKRVPMQRIIYRSKTVVSE